MARAKVKAVLLNSSRQDLSVSGIRCTVCRIVIRHFDFLVTNVLLHVLSFVPWSKRWLSFPLTEKNCWPAAGQQQISQHFKPSFNSICFLHQLAVYVEQRNCSLDLERSLCSEICNPLFSLLLPLLVRMFLKEKFNPPSWLSTAEVHISTILIDISKKD